MQLFELFIKGGYVMYPLLVCSFIVIVVFVERVRFYRSVSENVQELQELVNPLIAKHDWKAIISLKNTRSGMISHILAEAARGGDNIEKQEKLLEAASISESSKLRQYLSYIESIVTIAPLLGLLGTVTGMIGSFSILSISEGEPFAITGGVGEALIATATGLVVAIIAVILHTYLAHQQDVLISQIEDASSMYMAELAGENHAS
ncbi:MotA/TolQ/ExbB proton channel family protein [Veillonella montpellierensis]|uniref:MotA/TolQ/ExbB proton channel family protein n=1 Tax=Veillonella montpellierensis TaxID=187328 RepID=UPI0023F7DCC9|nr:MotA/TolQ/ExbB proton channel family protein [Veillonella montpellierensis]